MVSVQAYGTLESGAPAAARRRSTRAIAALAGLALVAVACLAVVESTRGASKVALEDSPKAAAKETGKEDTGPSTYKSWLGGLTADPASSADAGEQESETANAVLPFSAKIGSLQGTDFAQDVVRPRSHSPLCPATIPNASPRSPHPLANPWTRPRCSVLIVCFE